MKFLEMVEALQEEERNKNKIVLVRCGVFFNWNIKKIILSESNRCRTKYAKNNDKNNVSEPLDGRKEVQSINGIVIWNR